MDRVSQAQRSRNMAAVRSKNSAPELAVRRALFAAGYRYRLHRRDLSGTPDIVLPRFSAVIFVHGCFWHQHGCRYSAIPKTRRKWWTAKLSANRQRDLTNLAALVNGGWRVLIVWECSLKIAGLSPLERLDNIVVRVEQFLGSEKTVTEIPANIEVVVALGRSLKENQA